MINNRIFSRRLDCLIHSCKCQQAQSPAHRLCTPHSVCHLLAPFKSLPSLTLQGLSSVIAARSMLPGSEACLDSLDAYAGVILWEVCSREPLQMGVRRYLRHPRECPKSIALLAEACCSTDAEARPTMHEVCSIMERQIAMCLFKRAQINRQFTM